MYYCGFDVGSTTCKYVLTTETGEVVAQQYGRHNSKQAEMVLTLLGTMEEQHGLTPERDRIYFTGSGAGFIAPTVGAKVIQEVVAVAAAVERIHPDVHFVSEIGGEDMKTIFLTGSKDSKNKQVNMQSACSGGTGTFIEKTARKLGIVDQLTEMEYLGLPLHKISSKCGIFAEADSNSLVKAGVPLDEIVASLFEAVVNQNLSSLTKGNTPMPEVLLLGGPNLFFKGLQDAWRFHLKKLWDGRGTELPAGRAPEDLILVPENALYYAAQGCAEVGRNESKDAGVYLGTKGLTHWIEVGQHEQKEQEGNKGLSGAEEDLREFNELYGVGKKYNQCLSDAPKPTFAGGPVFVGCDFGSTTAKAVFMTEDKEVLGSCYALSKGNPIEDAKDLFRKLEAMGVSRIEGLGITGYGAELLKNIVGADAPVVETVAHATSGIHFFPDADCICDVGGVDVKIMMINNGAVSDFRLNSQCSSGNGAFLQGVAERFDIDLSDIAGRAFKANSMPSLAMGCGVFLQSDIVNQQRKGWDANEILAALCGILPQNVWIYAGAMNNMAAAGRKFILQGGTHRNLAVVKSQVDFIREKVPGAEIVVHPYSGEAGAIGAALCAIDLRVPGVPSKFRGFEVLENLKYNSTTADDTVCKWCPVNCQRTFIDVKIPGATGRSWSKIPVGEGWERVITNNSCPKGLVEDVNEMKAVKAEMEQTKRDFPNIGEMVRETAFRKVAVAAE